MLLNQTLAPLWPPTASKVKPIALGEFACLESIISDDGDGKLWRRQIYLARPICCYQPGDRIKHTEFDKVATWLVVANWPLWRVSFNWPVVLLADRPAVIEFRRRRCRLFCNKNNTAAKSWPAASDFDDYDDDGSSSAALSTGTDEAKLISCSTKEARRCKTSPSQLSLGAVIDPLPDPNQFLGLAAAA